MLYPIELWVHPKARKNTGRKGGVQAIIWDTHQLLLNHRGTEIQKLVGRYSASLCLCGGKNQKSEGCRSESRRKASGESGGRRPAIPCFRQETSNSWSI